MVAPIALFVYNRPEHTRRVISSLMENDLAAESDLFIFSDAEKRPEATAAVAEVRRLIRTTRGFRSIEVIEQDENQGLARSIIGGVTTLCSDRGQVIVVEDDLITAPDFLTFMNWGLETYRADERVASISGYWYPTARALPRSFFLPVASSWGWATWQRAWQLFEPDSSKLWHDLQREELVPQFDLDGAAPYSRMLRDHIAGRNDSWAIRWDASILLNRRLCLYASSSRVKNIGFDGSGTHCDVTRDYEVRLAPAGESFTRVPIETSQPAFEALVQYYKSQKRSLPARIVSRGIGLLRRARPRKVS